MSMPEKEYCTTNITAYRINGTSARNICRLLSGTPVRSLPPITSETVLTYSIPLPPDTGIYAARPGKGRISTMISLIKSMRMQMVARKTINKFHRFAQFVKRLFSWKYCRFTNDLSEIHEKTAFSRGFFILPIRCHSFLVST